MERLFNLRWFRDRSNLLPLGYLTLAFLSVVYIGFTGARQTDWFRAVYEERTSFVSVSFSIGEAVTSTVRVIVENPTSYSGLSVSMRFRLFVSTSSVGEFGTGSTEGLIPPLEPYSRAEAKGSIMVYSEKKERFVEIYNSEGPNLNGYLLVENIHFASFGGLTLPFCFTFPDGGSAVCPEPEPPPTSRY